MVFSRSVRSTRTSFFLVGAVVALTLLFCLFFLDSQSWVTPTARLVHGSSSSSPSAAAEPTLPHHPIMSQSAADLRSLFLEHLWQPSVAPTSKYYRPFGAYNWSLPGPPLWRQSLGEDLCIIDLDNRDFDLPGQIFGPAAMTWDKPLGVHGLSLGILNHWLYAKIHGYKYYYVAVDDPPDRRSSWKKPSVLARILREHDVCIYMDSDAIFPRLDLPFEWLLNYWQLYPHNNSLALALDPDLDNNKDRLGNLYLNTGFIVAQNNEKTYDILNAWHTCPDEGGPYYPECGHFRYNEPGRPTDQAGFRLLSYDYPDRIIQLPCVEANGFPQNDWGCKGQFLRHLWTGKEDQIKVDVGEQLPGPYLHLFHQQYRQEMDAFYMAEEDLMARGPKAATRMNTNQKARKKQKKKKKKKKKKKQQQQQSDVPSGSATELPNGSATNLSSGGHEPAGTEVKKEPTPPTEVTNKPTPPSEVTWPPPAP
ncbi:hypothetical protein XA68_13412 [Ophiocordyceps unilateralis]|uniref:Nucleotide-diphospho-sugar transferase domain-containing protein n=1 Tax=Ophiocordyceps unilateralis TaxID=268505 RepID=A0A2A9PCN0_OPHUN|nr:hypothetical protein XA68_13412 [Ophiocordyceps unilateralis]